MITDKSFRRLPLRDLLTDAEKRTRDLADHFTAVWMARLADLRDLSRPVRKRSHYPTLLALRNSLEKVTSLSEESQRLIDYLNQELEEIREHARRERVSRL
jgi:hypothetical protein